MGLVLSALYLAATTAGGVSLVALLPLRLGAIERTAFGFFLGLIPAGLGAFVLALAFGFGWPDYWLPALALAVGGAVAAWRCGVGECLRRSYLDALRPSPRWLWPLATLGLWGVYFTAFFTHAFVREPGGLYAGHLNVWGDWALHLSYLSSFAYGRNFPPQFPVLAGVHYEYHFLPDFVAAGFVADGLPPWSALAFGSWAAVLAFVAVFFAVARRLTGSGAAGFLAVLLFCCSGGLGFVYLAGDLGHALARGQGIVAFLGHLPRTYTQMPAAGYQWLTPIFAYLVPQRSMAFGLSVLLIVLVLVLEGVRNWSRPLLAAAGLLVGLSPLYHLHATLATGFVALLLAFVLAPYREPRRWGRYTGLWAAFALPAAALALPQMVWMFPRPSTGLGVRPQLGWLALAGGAPAGWPQALLQIAWFWLKNLTLFIPVAAGGHLLARRLAPDLARLALPAWLFFLIPNLFILQPWDWDNTKWFLIWFLPACILAAGALVWLGRRWRRLGTAAAAALVLLLCLAGAADAWGGLNYQQNRLLFADNQELQVAVWVRGHTPPRALFLTAEQHNHPVPTLAGRPIFIGYPGWLWVFTLPYLGKDSEARAIYSGDANAIPLLHQARIAYVVIGPEERSPTGMNANQGFFDAHFPLVFANASYRIYRVAEEK